MSLRDRLAKARRKYRDYRQRKADTRPHSDRRTKLAGLVRFWRGRIERLLERLRAQPDWNGHRPVLGTLGKRVVRKANEMGLVVTSTNDGGHSSTSYHYQNRAIDFGVGSLLVGTYEARRREIELQQWLDREYPNAREIFGPDSHYVKNGVRYPTAFPDHGDHTHFAY